MLVAFALWTVAFVGLSGVVAGWLGAEMTGGDVLVVAPSLADRFAAPVTRMRRMPEPGLTRISPL